MFFGNISLKKKIQDKVFYEIPNNIASSNLKSLSGAIRPLLTWYNIPFRHQVSMKTLEKVFSAGSWPNFDVEIRSKSVRLMFRPQISTSISNQHNPNIIFDWILNEFLRRFSENHLLWENFDWISTKFRCQNLVDIWAIKFSTWFWRRNLVYLGGIISNKFRQWI